MEALLKLKTGINSLNQQEFLNFINSFDKDYWNTVIFQYLLSKLYSAKSCDDINHRIVPKIDAFNFKISNIIISRPKHINDSDYVDINNDEKLQQLQLTNLPSVLISSISSYLEFKDILKLEISNKLIFINTRSPISLIQLPLFYANQLIKYTQWYGNIYHWHRFRSITNFQFDINKCFEIKLVDNIFYIRYEFDLKVLPFWSNLQELTIVDTTKDEMSNKFEENSWKPLKQISTSLKNLQVLRNETCLDVDILRNETCLDVEIVPNDVLSPEFIQMLEIYDFEFKKLSNNLRGIICNGTLEFNTYFPVNLESLHCAELIYSGLHEINIELNKLKELCMYFPNQFRIDWINKRNLNRLQRIHLSFECIKIDAKYSESLKILLSISSINYISFKNLNDDPDLYLMINILDNVLMRKKKQRMKVWISNIFHSNELSQNIIIGIQTLIQTLRKQATNFMLIIQFYGEIYNLDLLTNYTMNNNVIINSTITDIYTFEFKKFYVYKEYKLVISNKDCNIDGYQEKWLIDCENCKNYKDSNDGVDINSLRFI